MNLRTAICPRKAIGRDFRAQCRSQCRSGFVTPAETFALVPKLLLGNLVSEALGNCSLRCSTSCIHAVAASRVGKLELPRLRSQAGALVVIHKCLRDTVILAGMPESSHMDVKARPPVSLSSGRGVKVTQCRSGFVTPAETFALVPKLLLGNLVSEALGNCSLRCSTSCIHAVAASRVGKLELPRLHSQAGAWERAKGLNRLRNVSDGVANPVTLKNPGTLKISVLFVSFMDKKR
jgi:hypothetical protein